jgi:hypothetical protein
MGWVLEKTHHKSILLNRYTARFDVESISEFVNVPRGMQESISMIKHLILPETDLRIIKALSRKHTSLRNASETADYVQGKGEGKIFLLHG